MKTALVLVDLQNDYFPGGKNELVGGIEAGLMAKDLLEYFRKVQSPIVHIQHISTRPGAKFFLPDTEGVKIHPNVQPLKDEVVFQKHYPNSFRDTPLLDHLRERQVQRVVIAGMMTHMCVEATTRAAFDYGFECLLAQNACATKALTHEGKTIPADYVHLSFLAAIKSTYAAVLDANAMIAQLQEE